MSEYQLPKNTIVTVVARKPGKEDIPKDMTYGEALEARNKKSSYTITIYQKGFYQKPSKCK